MPLADLSIDDAIALACREVPECWPLGDGGAAGSVWKDGGDYFTSLISDDEGVYQSIVLEGPILHAVWFSAAWEWLIKFGDGPEFYRVIVYTTSWAVDKVKYLGGGLDSTSDVCLVLPTKYHALAAAVLLAAGKVVP